MKNASRIMLSLAAIFGVLSFTPSAVFAATVISVNSPTANSGVGNPFNTDGLYSCGRDSVSLVFVTFDAGKCQAVNNANGGTWSTSCTCTKPGAVGTLTAKLICKDASGTTYIGGTDIIVGLTCPR